MVAILIITMAGISSYTIHQSSNKAAKFWAAASLAATTTEDKADDYAIIGMGAANSILWVAIVAVTPVGAGVAIGIGVAKVL